MGLTQSQENVLLGVKKWGRGEEVRLGNISKQSHNFTGLF
jgi:hypothetical protein